jgi:pheromone shutdown protein TraB
VVQNIDYQSLPGEVFCPDMPAEEFQARWQQIPRWQRAATVGMVGSLTAIQRLFGSRWLQLLLEDSSLEDLPSNEEVLQPQLLPEVDKLLVDERDQRLVAALDDLHQRRAEEPLTVAVVYGAAHVRAVVIGLWRHGYRVHAGDWLTAMTFD